MTKRRLPLTFENALTKVAGHIGWPAVAEITGQAERTVRNWSDPDTTQSITLEAALKLDIAFHAAGGEGAPFLTCYATRRELECLAAVPGREALLTSIATTSKETGEAVHASLLAAHPAAERSDFSIAKREIEESIEALRNQLAALCAREKAALSGEADEAAEEQRVSEVAPIDTS